MNKYKASTQVLQLKLLIYLKFQIENCDRCQRNAREIKQCDVLHPVPVTPKPWYMIGIDIVNATKVTEKGNRSF